MLDIKIKLLSETAQIPVKAHPTDACFDVFADRIEQIEDDFYVVYLGFALEIPDNWKAVCVPRSSFTKTKWLVQNSPGQIDSSYRGELQYRFRAIPKKADIHQFSVQHRGNRQEREQLVLVFDEFPFRVGDRVGQMYFEPVHEVNFIKTHELSQTNRNEGGFGSTGK